MHATDVNKVWVSTGRSGRALLPKSAAGDAAKLLVFHVHLQRSLRNGPNAHKSQGGCLHL